MKRLLMCFVITAFVIGCGQTTPAVTTAPKPEPATNQTRMRAQSLTATPGVMQIVAHDGDKEANSSADKSLTNDDWNYSSTSAQSAFGKGVDWLETDVILNKPTGFLYMQHSADCKKVDGTTVDLMEAQPVQIGECAELFENQLDDIQRPGQWMIEIKGNLAKGSEMTSEYRVAVMDALFNVLDQRGRLSSEIITSMDKDVLRLFKERADRQQVSVHLGRVYPLSLVVNGDNRPTKSSLDADKAQGFEYSSAAVKDWTNENIDYAKKIGLQTMGWGWDDWWTGGRYPTLDNDDGIELCVDFMLTEAINDLQSKDKRCKRRLPSEPPVGSPVRDSKLPPSGNPEFDNLKPCAEGASDIDGKLVSYTSDEPCKPGESIWIAITGKYVNDYLPNDPDPIPGVSYHRVSLLKSLSPQIYTEAGSCGPRKYASWKNLARFWSMPYQLDLYFRCYAGYYSYTITTSYKFIRLSQVPSAEYSAGVDQTTRAWPDGLVER